MYNSLLYLLLKNGDFLNTDISQGSVATRLGCGGGICVRLCYKFPTESNSERILKIGRYLVKLWARVGCLVFFDSRCRAVLAAPRVGRCVNVPGSYFCLCLSPWTGPDCSEPQLSCTSHPCSHNGTCQHDPVTRLDYCNCTVSFQRHDT